MGNIKCLFRHNFKLLKPTKFDGTDPGSDDWVGDLTYTRKCTRCVRRQRLINTKWHDLADERES